MKNYSKQREAILNALRSTDTHPTASEVYAMVSKSLPNISLGTVYRNLDMLTKEGDILTISVGDGNSHFDGDNSNHIHLHCKECGKIFDSPMADNIAGETVSEMGFSPEKIVCVVYGICCDCKIKK